MMPTPLGKLGFYAKTQPSVPSADRTVLAALPHKQPLGLFAAKEEKEPRVTDAAWCTNDGITSPLLAWREPVYMAAGFAGIIAILLKTTKATPP